MARPKKGTRKKHMKLPNGFGSIKYLGSGRRNPYAVYPPVTEWNEKGPITPKALGYLPTWEESYELLVAYNMEKQGKIRVNRNVYIDRTPTFAEVYEMFYKEKYENPVKTYSKASMNSTAAAFHNCTQIHDIPFGQLRYDDLQNVLNQCPLRHASLELIMSLFKQIYDYAIKYDIVEKNCATYLYIPKADDDEHGQPFTEDELKVMWKHKNDDIIQMLLIMCYSGYRIAAYTKMEVNFDENYFKGGVKTKSSKNRIVPIHSKILDLVRQRDNTNLLGCSSVEFRSRSYDALESLGMLYTASGQKHTPHDCRHTFSALCEKYKVNENDRKRMLGHSFGNDITNAVYGHRTVEDLRIEIEKIKLPKGCC